jgi:hypothetical protein
MGMSSYFRHQEIKVLDEKGLLEAKADMDDDEWAEYILDNGEIDFDQFDGWKIYSYLYAEMCASFTMAAQFIEGFAEFRYEEGDIFRIVFKDKKWYLQETELKWMEPKEVRK